MRPGGIAVNRLPGAAEAGYPALDQGNGECRVNRIIGALIVILSLTGPAAAAVKCADVKYGTETYIEKMEELAIIAKLPDNYFNRYHEDVVSAACNRGKDAGPEIRALLERGAVKPAEVRSILKALGITGIDVGAGSR
jgi:hypothetical protein